MDSVIWDAGESVSGPGMTKQYALATVDGRRLFLTRLTCVQGDVAARSCTPLPPALAVGMPRRMLRHFPFTAHASYDAAAQPIWPIRVLVLFFAKKEIDFGFVLHGKHVSDQGQTLIRQPLAASR